MVNHHLKYKVIDTTFSESIQNIGISIETQFGQLTILCIYSPPNNRFDSTKLKDLINNIPKPCIIMGDFNAHSLAFGCHSDNNRGRCLYNIIDEFDLCIMNDGSPTTVPYPNRHASAIDLALVSPSIAHLCNWYVHDDPMGSYHLPTLLEVNIQPSIYDTSPPPLIIRRLMLVERFLLKVLASNDNPLIKKMTMHPQISQSISLPNCAISASSLISGVLPSHSGISGNEIVDIAARLDQYEDQSQILKVPFTDYYRLFKEFTRQLWKDYWKITLEIKGKWYAEIQKELPSKPWYNNLQNVSRSYITMISRMRLGHCLTPAHLNRIHVYNNSRCSHCGVDNADLDHIILRCSTFKLQRLILVSEISDISDNNDSERHQSVPRSVQELLSNKNYFSALYKYICNTVGKI